jgi:hypothetical protein
VGADRKRTLSEVLKLLTEHQEQIRVVDWLDHIASYIWKNLAIIDGWSIDPSDYSKARPQMRIPYYATPNQGAGRNKITGKRLKDEGVRAGVPDLCICVPMGGYHGLYIEMKTNDGSRASKKQKVWLAALEAMGYLTAVCNGHQEAIQILTDHFNGKIERIQVQNMAKTKQNVTRKAAILAHCWECMGNYIDGKLDCENTRCALYSFMPYRKLDPNLEVFHYAHNHKGKHLKEKFSRPELAGKVPYGFKRETYKIDKNGLVDVPYETATRIISESEHEESNG